MVWSLYSYNDIIALNQCIQKKVTHVTVIRGTFMSEDFTVNYKIV